MFLGLVHTISISSISSVKQYRGGGVQLSSGQRHLQLVFAVVAPAVAKLQPTVAVA
jgi:hypothetical protein